MRTNIYMYAILFDWLWFDHQQVDGSYFDESILHTYLRPCIDKVVKSFFFNQMKFQRKFSTKME